MLRQTVSLLFGISLAMLVSGGESSAQSINIFSNTALSNASEGNQTPITLGVKFWSSQSGTVSAIRFYRGTTSPQGYVARLYSASGTLLGSVTMATESGPVPGWQVGTFASPIAISPNTTYVAAYYVPSGEYLRVLDGLTQGVATGPLTAPASSAVGGNGVYHSKLGFPKSTTTWNANYLADVLFTPTGATLVLNFNP